MRKWLILSAVGVVVTANVWGVMQASRNRAEARGGRLELSEDELRFEPPPLESTAMQLSLQWRNRREDGVDSAAPTWLETAKLAELGFDCRRPVDSPGAREHYSSMAPRRAFLVLRRAADFSTVAPGEPKQPKGLVVVDAGPDPSQLRARYPDAGQNVIARGVVRLIFQDHNRRENKKLPIPRLEGRIEALEPGNISVPLPYSRVLSGFLRDASKPKSAATPRPRFTATVCWGANYEPWLADLRLVEATQ